jgi:hypothetical protein
MLEALWGAPHGLFLMLGDAGEFAGVVFRLLMMGPMLLQALVQPI